MKRFLQITMLSAAAMLAGCVSSQPEKDAVPEMPDTDPLLVQLSTIARTSFASGNVPRAIVLYRRVLDRARAMDNSREIGVNAYNLAACLVALEDWDEAGKLLAEAERELTRAGEDPAPSVLLLAQIQRKKGDWKQAVQTIDRLEMLEIDHTARGQAYVTRANIACDRGQAAEAEAHLDRARGFLRRNSDSGLAGEISHTSGRIALLKEDWNAAAAAFDREAAWMQRSGRLFDMAGALEQAGESYELAGDPETAVDRFYRSARSLMAQEHYLDALRVIERAVELQDTGTPTESASAVASLFNDIEASIGGLHKPDAVAE